MRTAYLFVGLLGLWHFVLSALVSITRVRSRTSLGCQDDPENFLYKAVVAQRNSAEYVPLLCLLMLALQHYGAPNWVVWTYTGATVGRYLHSLGILTYKTMKRPNVLRSVGAVLTYLCGLLMSVTLIAQVFR